MTSVAYETSQTIQIVTLVDITENGNKEQLSNLNTVHQVLQLRSQPFFDKRIQTFPADITTFQFGSKFKGEHQVWILQFNIDQPEVYKLDNDPIGLLKQDFDAIPVNVTLEETALFKDQCFKTSDTEHCNIVFKLIT